MITLKTDGIRLDFDPDTGLIDGFTVKDGGIEITPLHRAPWVATGERLPDGLAAHMYTLGGDFFCAPFGQHTDEVPLHGWPPNSPWTVDRVSEACLAARLKKPVSGAELTKELWLLEDHPFVYQRHTFSGGRGRLPVANHANLSVRNGGLIRTSAKQVWMTPPAPLETDPTRGRSGLSYPARSFDPARFPAGSGRADLTRYPWFPQHEDFVIGIEAQGSNLGWTAVTRPVEGDVFLSLRRADCLPMTMLWHSNGGRDYAPWNGRHFGCLGIEEGAADHLLGEDHGLSLTGPGAIDLSAAGEVCVTHVIGAIAWPDGCAVRDVELVDGQLLVSGDNGAHRSVPFDESALSST